MIPILLMFAQAAPTVDARGNAYEACAALTQSDPSAARASATRWVARGGGFLAKACLGLGLAADANWTAAAGAFDEAAHGAEIAHDVRAATFRAQAGNAWLAAGDAVKARTALDAALAAGTLTGLALGEAQLDHARALVAGGEMEAARIDLDHALVTAQADPLAWLLSATLARRMNDLPRAKRDIAGALLRSSDDAQVQLEAGNIAAESGDEARARTAWALAARLAPNAPAGKSAVVALKQFDGIPK